MTRLAADLRKLYNAGVDIDLAFERKQSDAMLRFCAWELGLRQAVAGLGDATAARFDRATPIPGHIGLGVSSTSARLPDPDGELRMARLCLLTYLDELKMLLRDLGTETPYRTKEECICAEVKLYLREHGAPAKRGDPAALLKAVSKKCDCTPEHVRNSIKKLELL